jgi:hypothetical protein
MQRHVFQDERKDDGSRLYSAAFLNADGALVIETHDLGHVVELAFGMSEYEAEETFTVEQTQRLRESLGPELIAAIADRFAGSLELKKYAESLGIGRGKLWTRIGD